tara:strand:- start:1270 stop:1542 length:273 start_codon:yes stop_codon:yes gene_type:complete
MPRTSFGKTRDQAKPYAIYTNSQGWEWRVLKTFKHSSAELKDPYARWTVAVTSPMMPDGQYETGDDYAAEIKKYGQLVLADTGWMEEYSV